MMPVLVIIPARGGSKGIKDKNIIDMQWFHTNGELLKLVVWYDNEWGYSARIASAQTDAPIYHRRYYSDFDMWLRYDKDWIHLVNDILNSEKPPHITKYINHEIIQKTLVDHLESKASNIRDIIRWLTLETLLKIYS